MIQRHIRDGKPSDIINFDYFNDGADTIKWLEALIAQIPDKREQHRLQSIADQLKLGLEANISARKLSKTPPAPNLDEASRNPDGTYNGVKALKWLSDALGGKLTEAEIQAEWEKAKARKKES